MMLTKAGEYAVRCMLYMSRGNTEGVVARKEIAETMDIPGTFLAKIAQELARAGLIQIVQGPRGGYRLLKAPEDILLLDVIEAVEGEIFLNECLFRQDSCGRTSVCGVHRVWQNARAGLRETLSVPLSELQDVEQANLPD
ncbi:RrF2 family transcriptional regulator [Desulfonatronum thioautotrophicum]|uniref:RrF2 family transcriptional regulator n=1 Tax=Desulfonatronum thioautotrophicum TaxID=617001 RepID=UPI0005EAFD6E|nr:Rrf2 family transcriptional regulator [Desulfonatronum thioautotrophicum]